MSDPVARGTTLAEYKARVAREMPESAFQHHVCALLTGLGYALIYHTHDSRRSQPGFPDLVAVHPRTGVVYIELKSAKGKVSAAQQKWIAALESAGQRVFVWRPTDFISRHIESTLRALPAIAGPLPSAGGGEWRG